MAKFGKNNIYKNYSLGTSPITIVQMANGVQQAVDTRKYQAGLFNENYSGLIKERNAMGFVKMKPTMAKKPGM